MNPPKLSSCVIVFVTPDIEKALALTSYGSREFVFADLDGHLIGVGLIKDESTFFG